MNRAKISMNKVVINNMSPLKYQKSCFCFQAPPIFSALVIDLMPPCGLHLILAVHRYLWKFLYDIINKRGQDNIISNALRHISLDYLAYQIDSYFKW